MRGWGRESRRASARRPFAGVSLRGSTRILTQSQNPPALYSRWWWRPGTAPACGGEAGGLRECGLAPRARRGVTLGAGARGFARRARARLVRHASRAPCPPSRATTASATFTASSCERGAVPWIAIFAAAQRRHLPSTPHDAAARVRPAACTRSASLGSRFSAAPRSALARQPPFDRGQQCDSRLKSQQTAAQRAHRWPAAERQPPPLRLQQLQQWRSSWWVRRRWCSPTH